MMNAMSAKLITITRTINNLLQTLLPVADLVARLYIAKVFILSGWNKISDWETTLYLFREEYHVPLLNPEFAAVFASAGELALPVLLVTGIFTQLSALGLFVLNIVAVVSYYATLSQSPAALTDHLQWGIMLAVLMTMPERKLALEYFVGKYFLRGDFARAGQRTADYGSRQNLNAKKNTGTTKTIKSNDPCNMKSVLRKA